MPALTVADPSTLPRIAASAADGIVDRPVVSVTTAPAGFEGEGFPVRRAFAGVDAALLDPFIHMDQMGEVEYAPGEPKGTDWHPHRGFETVTYMLDGAFQHQDSIGGGGRISGGDTQWMTAGAGILHIEAPPEELVVSGGLFHGLQLWVNLPAADKGVAPRYQDITGDRVALLASPDGGAIVRVIAGDLSGMTGPSGPLSGMTGPGVTHTPMAMTHVTVSPGARLTLPWPRQFNALVYALSGRGTVGAEGRPLAGGQLAVLGPSGPLSGMTGRGDTVSVGADADQDSRSPALEVIVLGGRPIGEPVAWYGPFVMNTRAELVQAIDDYRAGRLGTIPAVHIGG